MGRLRERRRKHYHDHHPMDETLWRNAVDRHPVLRSLTADEATRLRELAVTFGHEKAFAATDGLEVTSDLRTRISLLAVLPVLGIGIDQYRNWKSVVIVPGEFIRHQIESDEAGVVHEWSDRDVGESWDDGPVTLSLVDVNNSGRGKGYNVVIHEAAHRLDLTDGSVNGRPALHRTMSDREWFEVSSQAFELLTRRSRSRRPAIDPYALESDGEFFAVLTECFFDRPVTLRTELPRMYELFVEYYRQDPASRIAR
jgi:MtfA peptidase